MSSLWGMSPGEVSGGGFRGRFQGEVSGGSLKGRFQRMGLGGCHRGISRGCQVRYQSRALGALHL